MANATGTYKGEEVIATFSAEASPDWIGDPSVPNGTQECVDIQNIELVDVTILGVELSVAQYKHLPEALQAAVLELADEVEWEIDSADDGDADYDLDREDDY